MPEPAAHSRPTAAEAKADQPLGYPAVEHQLAREDEERDGQEREDVDARATMRWKATRSGSPSHQNAVSAAMPRAKATGRPMMTQTAKVPSSSVSPMSMGYPVRLRLMTVRSTVAMAIR